jgi:hypothetical protein
MGDAVFASHSCIDTKFLFVMFAEMLLQTISTIGYILKEQSNAHIGHLDVLSRV